MSRFDNPRNTAPSLEALQNQFLKVPRSTHDYSCTKHFNAWCGVLMPIDHIDTLPNEDYYLDYDIVLESITPLVKNLKTGFTLYCHAFYMRDSQLWEGAENFYSRGRSGNVNLSKPYLMSPSLTNGSHFISVLSLPDFLGFPVYAYHAKKVSGQINKAPALYDLLDMRAIPELIPHRMAGSLYVSALPYVMYQRVYTEFYLNQNLLIDNKGVLPDNVNHMILPYNCPQANFLDYSTPFNNQQVNLTSDPDGTYYVPSNSNQIPLALTALRYRQKKGDYFTTALPFDDLVRGSIPSISMQDLGASASIDASDAVFAQGKRPSDLAIHEDIVFGYDSNNDIRFNVGSLGSIENYGLKTAFEKLKVNLSMQLTLRNLRALEAYTIFAERMARTNGKYNDMIKAQFGYNPHARTLDPTYIGGFYQNVDINSVTQSAPDSSGSSLGVGSMTSKAISAGRNNLGHFHSPDYGHIMVIASIVPDMVYSNQGIERNQTKLSQSEIYFPLLENLSPQVILNRELYISATTSVDNAGFGWTELFSEYKSRQNKAYGLIGASDGDYFADSGAYVSKYLFDDTPTLNNEFETLSPKNIPTNIWQNPSEVPFIMTVGCNVRKTTCMSYITQPGGLSSRIS